MPYTVRIRDTTTGEERERVMEGDWDDGAAWMWSEGNWACDCNRELEYNRAGGEEPRIASGKPCASGRYAIVWIEAEGRKLGQCGVCGSILDWNIQCGCD